MKTHSRIIRKLFPLLFIFSLLAGLLIVSVNPALAQSGTVTSSATPSDAAPAIGDNISVDIYIDVSALVDPKENALGSFSANLNWDPTVLEYQSNEGLQAGFSGVINPTNAAGGVLIFNGTNVMGATGAFTVLTVNFEVIGAGTSALDLEYTAMAAAITFHNVLPLLMVTDGEVIVPGTPVQYTLTVNTTGSGSVTLNPAGGTYDAGTPVQLTAVPAAGWQFDGWGGDLSGSTNPTSITMNSNHTVSATFSQIPTYTLTVNITGSGSVTRNPTGTTYQEGTVVQLTAVPAAGWQFDGWGGDLGGSTNPTSITMNSNHTVTATFSEIPPDQYALTILTNGSGSVTLNPTGGTYDEGTVVQLTAVPAAGWQFDGWGGDLGGSTNPTSITMNSNHTVTATFSEIPPDQFTLTMAVSPSGGGTTNPAVGLHDYDEGTLVNISASPTTGYHFVSWSGGVTNPASASTTVTMSGDKIVTATFAENSTGNTVTSTVMPSDAAPTVGDSINVTVHIDVSDLDPEDNALGSYTATLDWDPDILSYQSNAGLPTGFTGVVNVNNAGSGTITFNGANAAGATGNILILTVTFDVVGEGTSPLDLKYSVMAAAGSFTNLMPLLTIYDGQVVAAGSGVEHALTMAVTPAAGGTTSPATGVHLYAENSVVNITATPASGYRFVSWTGDVEDSGEASTTVTMDADKSVTANFELTAEYTLTMAVSPTGSGTTSPVVGTHDYTSGTVVQISASPALGYEFVNWTGAVANANNASTTVTMNGDRTVTANFENVPASGSASASAVASDDGPTIGDQITVAIAVDVSEVDEPDNALGSFSATLDWDPAVLAYSSNSGILGGFTGQINPSSGHLVFNGANPAGVTGETTVLTITFNVIGAGSSALDLGFSAMAAAYTFEDLLPLLTVTDDSITAIPSDHTLTVNTSGGGSVTLDPAGGTYAHDTVVTLTAVPASGWQFAGWSGAVTGTLNPRTITMDSDKTVTATFTEIPPEGSVTSSANASDNTTTVGDRITVAINIDVSNVNEPDNALGSFTATLDWDPAVLDYVGNGGLPDGFSGVINTNNAAGGTMTFNGANASGATGNIQILTLTFDVVGAGSSPINLEYSAIASATTLKNLMDILTVNDDSVQASLPIYALTVTVVGQGSVTLDPPGGSYEEGSTVQLTAVPAEGWQFDGWSGAVTGTDLTQTILMDAAKSVTATFSQIPLEQYTLTIETTGSGSVTLNPAGGTYDEGTEVQLTATPAAGWQFDSWTGDLESIANPQTIIMDSDKTVTANFSEIPVGQYALTILTNGQGSVTLDPAGGTYDEGTEVDMTAVPAVGWQFDGWSGAVSGTGNPQSITMDSDKTVTATFSQIPADQYNLTVNKVGSGTVTLDPSGGIYDAGTEVEVTAVPAAGWKFDGWSGALSGTTNPQTILMDGDKSVTATFSEIPAGQYALAIYTNGDGSVVLDPPGGLYDAGTVVELTAVSAEGWEFSGWLGDLSGETNPQSITMNGNKTVSATFVESGNRTILFPIIRTN